MIKTKENLKLTKEQNTKGEDKLFLYNIADFENINPSLRMFSQAELRKGEEVEFHIHEGESEIYYILSGKALYDDNGVKKEIGPGTVTYTPSGEGHGIKNIGDETLVFIAHIIEN